MLVMTVFKLPYFRFYYLFDCSSMDDDHLIETFYITKPHLQQPPLYEDQLPAQSLKKIAEASRTTTEDTSESNPPPSMHKNVHRDAYVERSYRMISKQINCSAAVSLSKGNRGSGTKKRPPQGNCLFMDQFEDFFRSFIPPERNNEDRIRKRKSSRTKTRIALPPQSSTVSGGSSTEDNQLQEQARQQFMRSQNREHLTFYQKLRDKIGQRVEPLIDKTARNKLHKVETRPKSKKTVYDILKEKSNLKGCQSHLRLSRTGLVIKLDSMQTKAIESNLRKIENQKPKKDMIFQRCLIKNCEIVLENLQNYQQQKENPSPAAKPHHRRYNSSILQKTHSAQLKTHTITDPSEPQDLSLLKLRQKCLKIELSCKRNYKNNGPLKEGLKVFGKYCNQVQKRLEAGEGTIQAVLNQKMEREDEAGQLYDSMANIEPIQAYLRSLQ